MNECDEIAKSEAIYLDTCALAKIEKEESGSNLVRMLVYASNIKIYASLVVFGEFTSILSREEKNKTIDIPSYIFKCRGIMNDFDMNKIKRIEPSDHRGCFISLFNNFLEKYSKLGSTDIWHLLAFYELKKKYSSAVFFTYDKNLANAARSESFLAIDGNQLDKAKLETSLRENGRFAT